MSDICSSIFMSTHRPSGPRASLHHPEDDKLSAKSSRPSISPWDCGSRRYCFYHGFCLNGKPHQPVYSKGLEDPLQTTTKGTPESKESTLFYSSNPFNSSWETMNPGCGVFRLWCGSLLRVHSEIGWQMTRQADTWYSVWGLCFHRLLPFTIY